ncbi:hypothetical protein U1Q18_015619, partial [Sarracenia purpurea var. burkii]
MSVLIMELAGSSTNKDVFPGNCSDECSEHLEAVISKIRKLTEKWKTDDVCSVSLGEQKMNLPLIPSFKMFFLDHSMQDKMIESLLLLQLLDCFNGLPSHLEFWNHILGSECFGEEEGHPQL